MSALQLEPVVEFAVASGDRMPVLDPSARAAANVYSLLACQIAEPSV